jgi:hypothetical protein
MNVGILTFHYGYNYGAILQCVGLYQTLIRLGHEVDVIDYQPGVHAPVPLWKGWGLRSQDPVASAQTRWRHLRYAGAMRHRFDQFMSENLSFSSRCDDENVAEVVSGYNALVVGSDQVWNRNYISVTPACFFNFSPEYPGRRISYAACCGCKEQPEDTAGRIERALLKFDALSVRNQVTCEWVHGLTGESPEIVCDPTLLFSYTGLESSDVLPFKKYILAYALGEEIRGGHRRAVAEIRNVHGDLPVVWVCPSAHKPESFCEWADHIIYTAGPAEWLGLIQNAAFVYTDSFHGAIFSIKYYKPFLAYYTEESRAERLLDLAKRYGVVHSVAGSLQDALERKCLETPPDYESVMDRIDHHRQISLSFLKESLSCE